MDKIKVGKRYGRLIVLENHHPKDEVVCQCDCGNIKIARATNVYYGGTKSCGCLFNEGNNRRHGDQGTRLYTIWKSMRERCACPSQNRYQNYGGRGIKVCQEWDDYLTFKEWALNNGYDNELTIDRIDVNGNYEPSNCRWVTSKQQSNNKTNNRYITYNGETKTMAEWSEIIGVKAGTIWSRLNKGWSIDEALTTPVNQRRNKAI